MRQAIVTIASVSLIAALCEQLMGKNRYFESLRFVLGLNIVLVVISMLEDAWKWLL